MAIAFLADEDLDFTIVRGIRQWHGAVDITTILEVGLRGSADPDGLPFAASVGRTLLSHDTNTMIDAAYARIARGETMTGLIVVNKLASIASILEDLEIVAVSTTSEDWLNRVGLIPF
jgi:Na+(H+)/acetate symporter ActP